MHSPSALLGVTRALLVVAAATSAVLAAPRSDLAVLRIRVPAHVKLSDVRLKASARGSVWIASRGSVPVVVADAATLAAVVQLSATDLGGPIVGATVGVAPVVALPAFS